MRIAVIGGGAAGFFAAISAKTHHPKAEVVLFEKSNKLLSKVRVSGGGRCNVTNAQPSLKQLADGYPRGDKLMKQLLQRFSNTDTIKWFESRGVPVYAQADTRVFPTSDNSQSIVDVLMDEAAKLGVTIMLNSPISRIENARDIWLYFGSEGTAKKAFDKVIVACGGSPKLDGLNWLSSLGHIIEPPVPSLFTFNIPHSDLAPYMGLSVPAAIVTVEGTKLKAEGAMLITHWGLSGPAVLKLSSFGARLLAEKKYDFTVLVNWVGEQNHQRVWDTLQSSVTSNPNKQVQNLRPFELSERLWLRFLVKAEIALDKRWGDLGAKHFNRLTSLLTNERFAVKGKTTFKEEFVTCGGVSLSSIHKSTLESIHVHGLYFAGEILDIDGITGGYNFQAAWTTGFLAGQLG